MRPTVFQKAELRDENDNIVQQGTYGKGSALSNSTNDGWIDYVMNNLEALRSMSVGSVIPVETLPESGETGKAYVVTTGTDAGKLFMWDGEDWVEITGSIGDYLPITGGTITGNLFVTGNATLSGTSTAVTPAVDDNSTKVATTEYVQTEVKPIETDVDIAEKDIANIKALLQGHLYNYQTDNSSAYTKSVPAGAMPYAGLEKVGGKTVVWNQLCRMETSIASQHGVTFTINDGVITTSGTADADFWVQCGKFYQNDNASVGDKLLFKMTPSGTAETFYVTVAKPGWSTVYDSVIFTKLEDTTQVLRLYIKSGTNMDGKKISFVGANLTKMFGAGNEPTVAEFEAMFPASYYPYNAGTLLSAGVTSAVSHSLNLADYSLGEGLPSDTTASNVPRKFPLGKYVVGITYNNQWIPARVTSHTVQNNIITQTVTTNATGIGIPFQCKSSTKYTVSVNLPQNGAFVVIWYKEDGTPVNSEMGSTTSPKTYRSPSYRVTGLLILYAAAAGTYTYSNVQIEEGENASPYRPAVLQTVNIPASIQALEGYGWGVANKENSAHNYIDFERKKFVQCVGKVTITSADVPAADSGYIGTKTFGGGAYAGMTAVWIRNFKYYSVGGTFGTFKYGGFPAVTPFSSDIVINNTDFISTQYRTYFIDIPDRDTLLAKIGDGVDMYYELETPIETDISAYLTDDNLINVEAGGTLTFPNSNGDDYLLPVPSEETYMIDLQSAL